MPPKTTFKSVDRYIASKPEPIRDLLHRVKAAIRKSVPHSEELISYNMPTYKINGTPVIYFAAWKHHYSIYPATDLLIAALKDELASYEIEKGTIRFPFDKPVPVKLITQIAKLRAKEAEPAV